MFFLDFLFPRRCLGCGKKERYFCDECLHTVCFLKKQICPVCEKTAIYGLTHPGCQRRYSLDGLISIFSYKGIIKKAITKLKYKFIADLAEEFADKAVQIIKQGKTTKTDQFKSLKWLVQSIKPVFVPIPLHPRRYRWRGFNQAELLGEMIAQRFDCPFQGKILLRHKYTKPQVELKSKERKTNVSGAFKITPNVRVLPFEVLLFDDVWTTGSTLKECSRVLKKAGVRKVWAMTLAR